jgi:hypothetical protein
MLGDLWHFPFWAEVWGTAAAWFGVLGTLASVGTAAFYYVKGQRREAKAQAHHVTFVHRHWTKDEYHAKVFNFSDESIFDVTPWQALKLFGEVVADECRKKRRALTTDEVQSLREEWNKLHGGTTYVQSLEGGHIKPGESKDVVFKGARNAMERYWIGFQDSMARSWTLELDTNEPQRIFDREYNRWNISRHWKKYRQDRQRRRQLRQWGHGHPETLTLAPSYVAPTIARKGWAEPRPERCPNGHELGAGRVLVGSQHCDCMRTHRTHTCRERAPPRTRRRWVRRAVGTNSMSGRRFRGKRKPRPVRPAGFASSLAHRARARWRLLHMPPALA